MATLTRCYKAPLLVMWLCQGMVFLLPLRAISQSLIANAGPDTMLCAPLGALIGGSPTAVGGVGPYVFRWHINELSASGFLSDTTVPNPELINILANAAGPLVLHLEVTDDTGAKAYDSVTVYSPSYQVADGFSFLPAEAGEIVTLHVSGFSGGFPPYQYDWFPKEYIAGPDDGTSIEVIVQEQPSLNEYAVQVMDAHGCVMEIGTAERIELLTGIPENAGEGQGLLVFPNPSRGRVMVSAVEGEVPSLKIYSIEGKETAAVMEKTGKFIHVSGLKEGVYLLKYNYKGQQGHAKLFIME